MLQLPRWGNDNPQPETKATCTELKEQGDSSLHPWNDWKQQKSTIASERQKTFFSVWAAGMLHMVPLSNGLSWLAVFLAPQLLSPIGEVMQITSKLPHLSGASATRLLAVWAGHNVTDVGERENKWVRKTMTSLQARAENKSQSTLKWPVATSGMRQLWKHRNDKSG